MEEITRACRLERVAKMSKSNKEASAALGIAPASFSRACRRHGIATPQARRRRRDRRPRGEALPI